MEPVTTLLAQGYTPETMLEKILDGFDVILLPERIPAAFSCNCSKERMEKALISLGSRELEEMVQEGEPIELHCHFCNTRYSFDVEELRRIKNSLKS